MAVFTRYSFRVCAAQKRQASSLVSPATAVDDTHGRLRAGTLLATAVDDSLKPVLNWANVCSPNILRTLRRTMIRFLIELLVRRIWFGQSKLYFVLNWLVMRCKLPPELAADAQQTA